MVDKRIVEGEGGGRLDSRPQGGAGEFVKLMRNSGEVECILYENFRFRSFFYRKTTKDDFSFFYYYPDPF